MSEHLARRSAYPDALLAGADQTVSRCWAPESVSHLTDRIGPDAVGTDRGRGPHRQDGLGPTQQPSPVPPAMDFAGGPMPAAGE